MQTAEVLPSFHGSGQTSRVGSDHPTRPARISRRLDPTRPDPTRPDPTRPDPTRPDPTRHTPSDPRGAGFMRVMVDWTHDISQGSKSKSNGSKRLNMYLGRLVGPWYLVLFPGCRALWSFYRHCLQQYYVVCARKMI